MNMLKTLVAAGADPKATNAKGETVFTGDDAAARGGRAVRADRPEGFSESVLPGEA
jgi:hypothetical protein